MTAHLARLCVVARLLALVLAGCASQPIEHFYTVSGAGPSAPEEASRSGAPVISVAPLRLPVLIDRPQLVLRTGLHEVEILEEHRWAEPLAVDLTRALIAGLRQDSPGIEFEPAEGSLGPKSEQLLEVDVTELLDGPGPVTSFQASWVIRDGHRAVVKEGKVARTVPTQVGPQGVADAYARAIAELAAAISIDVRLP
jgi:hypothetical protein